MNECPECKSTNKILMTAPQMLYYKVKGVDEVDGCLEVETELESHDSIVYAELQCANCAFFFESSDSLPIYHQQGSVCKEYSSQSVGSEL